MRIYQLIGMVFLGLLASNALSQEKELNTVDIITTSFPCYNTKELFNSLRTEYKEVPFIFGKSDDMAKSTFSMWINAHEKTFTLIATIDQYSCVVGSGSNFRIVPKELALGK